MIINGKNVEYEIIRSNRKTLGIQVSPDGKLIARAPMRMSAAEIERFIISKSDWVEKHVGKCREEAKKLESLEPFSMDDIRKMADDALAYIPGRVKHYAALMGVTYGRITIRNQRSKWGSCTSTGNLNFNCLLMMTPPEVIDSVVVHELCHRKHMDHSKAFYADVYRVFPEYDKWHGWLKENGGLLIKRMTMR